MSPVADTVPLPTVLFGDLPLAAAREFVRLAATAPDLRLIGPIQGAAELAAQVASLRPALVVAAAAQLPVLAGLTAFIRPTRVLLYAAPPELRPWGGPALQVCGSIEPLPLLLAERALWRQSVLHRLRLVAVGLAGAPWKLTRLAAPALPAGVVVIGASTGGPGALETVLAQLRPGLRCAVVVAVHLPGAFTASLVARLQRAAVLPVLPAVPGGRLVAGQVVVIPGGTHMAVRRSAAGYWTTCLAPEMPPTGGDVPSIDLLMSSAAATTDRLLGVVLTGLGHDGTRGARAIRERGGQVLVQDAASAAVFSMPGAVLRAGLASAALPLAGLAAAINAFGTAPTEAAVSRPALAHTHAHAV